MSVELVAGSPQAAQLQNQVQSRLVELEFSTEDDAALAEYIVLMVGNGKTQEQITVELATDFLGIETDNPSVLDFGIWLSEQVSNLTGGSTQVDSTTSHAQPQPQPQEGGPPDGLHVDDSAMADVQDDQTEGSIGPRSMRNGGAQRGRDKRMLGQMNRQLDRGAESSLHKIRGAANTGRINSHAPREAPKGPTPKGPRNMGPVRGGMGMGMPAPRMAGNLPGPAASSPLSMMTPQQQLQLFQMAEEQAKMMAQILQGPSAMPMNAMSGAFNPQAGKSMFERVDTRPQRPNGNYTKRSQHNSHIPSMDSNISTALPMDPTSSMEVESSDPSTTICRYNLACTRPDCIFVHQSPAAPPGTTIDMDVTCTFGAACKNKKCVGKHPSPGQRSAHNAMQECRFYPNCTNPVCPFIHPGAPPCRNGAHCSVPGCTFVHSKVACRYNPCLNPQCPFKHAEGQKRGKFGDKVWSADKDEHVSERKFVVEDGPEDLIRPGEVGKTARDQGQVAVQEEDVVV